MPNSYFKFKKFTVWQDQCAMKVSSLACVLGAYANEENTPKRILDIGTGTGLLALMMAQKYPDANIDGVEIEHDAYQQAKYNVGQSPWSDRIKIFHHDFLSWQTDVKYDLIISNPPFFERNLPSPDSKINLARHDSGLKAESLVKRVVELLSGNGKFYVLLPSFEMERFISICTSHQLSVAKKLDILNFKGKSPKAVIACFSYQNAALSEETIIIRKNTKEYSEEFKRLLKAYYLHL